jgi:gamma-glutamyl:cysteine ligase YbdK (ATP-grasp superfamily)
LQQIQETSDELVKEKIDEHSQKLKAAKEKGIEKAVEKVRVELRNQLEAQKNEFAKAKADW